MDQFWDDNLLPILYVMLIASLILLHHVISSESDDDISSDFLKPTRGYVDDDDQYIRYYTYEY